MFIFREKMKISQADKAYKADELIRYLGSDYPGIKKRTSSFFVVPKNKTIAAEVFTGNNQIIVQGSWASSGARTLFYVSLLVLGVIIPLIIYLSIFRPRMKRFEKEVGQAISDFIT